MKRLLAISFLAFYLSSFTELHEVLRLPLLIQHFAEHKGQVADMTFLQFLAMHYETDVAHDDQDNTLPFKDCSHSSCCQTVVLPVQKFAFTEASFTYELRHSFFYLLHKPQLLAGDIFQPPKLS